MDVPLIEQVKIQAQILVPLVKALRVELGEERANHLVRRTLGGIYPTPLPCSSTGAFARSARSGSAGGREEGTVPGRSTRSSCVATR